VGTGGSFSVGKQSEREADHSTVSTVEVKQYLSCSVRLHAAMLNYALGQHFALCLDEEPNTEFVEVPTVGSQRNCFGCNCRSGAWKSRISWNYGLFLEID
jgi:hypothetical protein